MHAVLEVGIMLCCCVDFFVQVRRGGDDCGGCSQLVLFVPDLPRLSSVDFIEIGQEIVKLEGIIELRIFRSVASFIPRGLHGHPLYCSISNEKPKPSPPRRLGQ
jgi:hypothetical protein